jgi:hypothetical protein
VTCYGCGLWRPPSCGMSARCKPRQEGQGLLSVGLCCGGPGSAALERRLQQLAVVRCIRWLLLAACQPPW